MHTRAILEEPPASKCIINAKRYCMITSPGLAPAPCCPCFNLVIFVVVFFLLPPPCPPSCLLHSRIASGPTNVFNMYSFCVQNMNNGRVSCEHKLNYMYITAGQQYNSGCSCTHIFYAFFIASRTNHNLARFIPFVAAR